MVAAGWLGPAGTPVRIEAKKVDRPDARFAMTNNEMSHMPTQPGGYLLAIVAGDGRHAQLLLLLLLDSSQTNLPKERVCRRWDWEFTDWSRFARVAGELEVEGGLPWGPGPWGLPGWRPGAGPAATWSGCRGGVVSLAG
ncbi:hypothetical protein [Streptomyces buecherae]|uniref:hypothetical protein n=1 Tax=Streptomyces buecherae TaxID=2763006 RepID=UPI003684F37D